MNLKALIALIVAAGVAIALTSAVLKKDSASWQTVEVGGLLFENLPVNDVDKINITQGEQSLTLYKQDDIWVVKDRFNYPASFQQISDLALALSELKPLRVIEAGPSQFGRLNLLAPTEAQGGTLLEVKDKNDKALASLLLGKPYIRQNEAQKNPMMGGGDMPEGRYVLVGSAAPVYLVGETFQSVAPSPVAWLNKDFFKVEKLSSVSVQFMGESAIDWEFTREAANGEFKLTGQQPTENVDPSKVRSLSSVFSYASFTDVLPADADPELTRLELPTIVVLKTLEGFTYTIHIGKLTADETGRYLSMKVDANLPTERVAAPDEKEEDKARLDSEFQRNTERLQKKLAKEKQFEKWVYVVSTWTVENLLKNRINWMKDEDPNAVKAGDATSVPDLLARPEDNPEESPEAVEPQEETPEEVPPPAEPTGNEEVVVLEEELDNAPMPEDLEGDGNEGDPEPELGPEPEPQE